MRGEGEMATEQECNGRRVRVATGGNAGWAPTLFQGSKTHPLRSRFHNTNSSK